jgi:hypothetical protein
MVDEELFNDGDDDVEEESECEGSCQKYLDIWNNFNCLKNL